MVAREQITDCWATDSIARRFEDLDPRTTIGFGKFTSQIGTDIVAFDGVIASSCDENAIAGK